MTVVRDRVQTSPDEALSDAATPNDGIAGALGDREGRFVLGLLTKVGDR
jgi:hypothetical protein